MNLRNISSTAIRQGLQFDTKPSILEYMMRECMYVDEMLKTRLSEIRYQHSLRVVELAKELAIHHKIDLKAVSLAAYMHDYCKENYDDIYFEAGDVHQALYHGFAAASFLSKKYYIKDKRVLKAIESHVSGSGTHPLSMILYIADKCERGRNYDSEPLIALAKQDLRKGFKQVKLEAEKYRKKA